MDEDLWQENPFVRLLLKSGTTRVRRIKEFKQTVNASHMLTRTVTIDKNVLTRCVKMTSETLKKF